MNIEQNMFIPFLGGLFLAFGVLVLVIPLILTELSRPRDWLMGGILLFLGLFLLEENDILRGSINLLLVAMAILIGKMMLEIFQNRWNQLSGDEKKGIRSFERWLKSFKQLGQILGFLSNGFLNFFKVLTNQSDKSLKEKKWVHPVLKEEIKNKADLQSNSTDSIKIRKEELSENEESS